MWFSLGRYCSLFSSGWFHFHFHLFTMLSINQRIVLLIVGKCMIYLRMENLKTIAMQQLQVFVDDIYPFEVKFSIVARNCIHTNELNLVIEWWNENSVKFGKSWSKFADVWKYTTVLFRLKQCFNQIIRIFRS